MTLPLFAKSARLRKDNIPIANPFHLFFRQIYNTDLIDEKWQANTDLISEKWRLSSNLGEKKIVATQHHTSPQLFAGIGPKML